MIRWLVRGLMAIAGAYLFVLLTLNLLLGCETWDRSQWTPQSSCVTPAELLGGFFSF